MQTGPHGHGTPRTKKRFFFSNILFSAKVLKTCSIFKALVKQAEDNKGEITNEFLIVTNKKDQKGLIKEITILSVPGFSSAKLAFEI